jgi:hypothetical protein
MTTKMTKIHLVYCFFLENGVRWYS